MTNGEKILSTFPNAIARTIQNEGFTYIEVETDEWITGFDDTWWTAEYKEPTTNNDLVVEDCVSRAEVLKLMKDNWRTHNGDWAMQESMDDIRALPSVTPIRPKGQWIDHSDDGYVECPKCGSATNCDDNIADLHFCFSCGADMREVKE